MKEKERKTPLLIRWIGVPLFDPERHPAASVPGRSAGTTRVAVLKDRPDGRGRRLAQAGAQPGAGRAVGLRLHDPQARTR
jgi:hypothetical protein